jgi:hypothetical protein
MKQLGKGPETMIPDDYFSFLNDQNHKMSFGSYIEKLAKYGDPSYLDLPIGLKSDQNADFSFSGLKTKIQSIVSYSFVNHCAVLCKPGG